jgi:hypothetical protein
MFDGKVDTRIGKLEFDNQYPSKASMDTILDSMDFHGATQAYLSCFLPFPGSLLV